MCARLLHTSEEVRILATSREPLRVTGEEKYRLAPFPLPELPSRLTQCSERR